MMQYGLAQFCRLHLKNDFKKVIQGGIKLQRGSLTLWCRPGPESLGPTRFAVVISGKFGIAVQRNRAKRLLREAFRLNREILKPGYDLVVSPRKGEVFASSAHAAHAFLALCDKAGLLRTPSDKAQNY